MIDFTKMAEEINRMEWGQAFRSVKTDQELASWKRFFRQQEET